MSVTERVAAAGADAQANVARVRVRLAASAADGATAPLFDREIALDLPPGVAPRIAMILTALPGEPDALNTGAPAASLDLSPPVIFCRALDGWVFFATPDHAAWRALCMTFLNADVYRRFDAATAWRSAEVCRLTELALGTYAVNDLSGRCLTFAIPCLTVYDGRGPLTAAVRGGQVTFHLPPSLPRDETSVRHA